MAEGTDIDSGARTEERAAEPDSPVLRVVRGNPDDAELAALVTVLTSVVTAAGANGAEGEPARLNRWGARDAGLRWPGGRRPLRPGPDGWRASTLPG